MKAITVLGRVGLGIFVTVTLFLGAGLATPAAEAATGSVALGNPSVTAALDVSSKGSVSMPKVSAKGKAKITKRSFVITKGGRVIARTSVAGKKFALGVGAYQVRATVTYKVGSKKRTTAKTFAATVGNSSRMTYREYQQILPGQTLSEVAGIVGGWGTPTSDSHYRDCDYDYENDIETCVDIHEQRREWRTASDYGFGAVYFTNGRVDDGYNKFYAN